MTTFFAAISVLAGVLMIASKSRTRFPCFVGGCAAILAGGLTSALPILDSVPAIGWIWFCLWIASLPCLIVCVVSLIILTARDRRLLTVTVLGGVAILSNISPTLAFIDGAAAGVVDAGNEIKMNKTSPFALALGRVQPAMIVQISTQKSEYVLGQAQGGIECFAKKS